MAIKEEILISLDFETGDFTSRAQELNKQISNLNTNQKELRKSGQEGSVQFQKNVTALRSNRKELAEINKTIDNVNKANNEQAGSNEQLKATLSVLTLEFNKLSKAERANGARGKELSASINKVTADLKKNESAVGNNARNVGNYSDALQDSNNGLTDWVSNVAGATAVIGLASLALNSLVGTYKEANEALKTSNNLFNESAESIEQTTINALALADVFDKDVETILISSKILAEEFGISGVAATELVEEGFRKGADANGEFLDILKEYPAQLRQVGLSAEESIALITSTAQQGVFSDKGIDAIKEAGVRLREFTPATKEAIDGIGLSSAELQKGIEEGSISIFEATQQISARIGELPEDSQVVGTALADIFGGAGEDAGLRFIKGISEIETELDDLDDKTDEFVEGQLELAKAWNGLALEGSNLNGVLGGLTTQAAGLINSFSTLIEFDFSRIFDAESPEQQNRAMSELSSTMLTLSGNIGIAEEQSKRLEQTTKLVEDAARNLGEEQLKTKENALVVVKNFQAIGFSLDEAIQKYKELSGVQSQSERDAEALAKTESEAAANAELEAKARLEAQNKSNEATKNRSEFISEAVKQSQEELDLFIAQQGLRAKTLEEELVIAQQIRDKEIELLEQQREFKLISETKFQEELININEEFALKQAEVVIDNSNRELQIILENNASKIEAGKFLNDELFKQEQDRLNNVRDAEFQFQAQKLEQGTIDQEQFNEAVNTINQQNSDSQQALEEQKSQADNEAKLIDLENQREIDLLNREDEFQLRQEDLDRQREQEVLNAESTGADISLIEDKFAKFQEKLDKDKRQAQVGEALTAFNAIGQLASGNAEAEKAFAITSAVINAYQGITAVLAAKSTIPEPAGSILKGISAAAIGASAFQNVNRIRSTKVPKAARGMATILGGDKHSAPSGGVQLSADGVPFAMAERGELLTIVNAKNTSLLSRLSAANSFAGNGDSFFGRGGMPSFQDGGIGAANIGSTIEEEVGITNQLVEAIESTPPPVVLVQDISEKQDDVNEIEVRTTL